jgi:hypothetical protein
MKLGISSYAFTWAIGVPGNMPELPMDCFQLLQKAIDFQVSCVQIADNLPIHKLEHSERYELLKRAQNAQISIEVGMRVLTAGDLGRYIDLAEYFRSPIVSMMRANSVAFNRS